MACPGCVSGFFDVGVAKGKELTIADLPTYLSTPANPNGHAVVIATDIFGYRLINARLIADAFADQGFTVFIPDLFQGDPMDMSCLESMEAAQESTGVSRIFSTVRAVFRFITTMRQWFPKHPFPPVIEDMKRFIAAAKAEYEVEKVAIQGYCYGGKVAVLLAGEEAPVVDAISVAHPSALEVPKDIEPIKVPSLFACAESDWLFNKSKRTTSQKILEAKQGVGSKFVVYPGTQHGFAVRGNKNDPVVCKARAAAAQEAVSFLQDVFEVKADPATQPTTVP